MSLVQVAKIAGVSTSTVSRVLNNHPRVAPSTVSAVRQAMEQIDFTPRRNGRRRPAVEPATRILFLVLGSSEASTVPAFEQLLRGVSTAAEERGLNLSTRFVTDLDDLCKQDIGRRFQGVLLHGDQPSPELQARFASLPTVWLMANRTRPSWGDQVMPDSATIGELAADYLLQRGHEHLAFVSLDWTAWSFEVRARAFERAVTSAGKRVTVLHAPADDCSPHWRRDPRVAQDLSDRLIACSPSPTGIFVAEDSQLIPVVSELWSRNRALGRDAPFDFVSCNNERPYLLGLNPPPATIDIRSETIGRRAVEQLLIRMDGGGTPERVRTMIEPYLVAEALA